MTAHPIPPLFSDESETLILGSFPSVKSRESGFFYGCPQNRFWPVLSIIFGEKKPESVKEKKSLVLRNRLALWDVVGRCDVAGSSDASVKNVEANDISVILGACPIKRIFVNGKTSEKYYNRLILPKIGVKAAYLPSTSSANASWSLEKLVEAWKIIG